MTNHKIKRISRALTTDDVLALMRVFRSIPASATDILDVYAELLASGDSQDCTSFLKFHRKFEELSGLQEKQQLTTAETRIAVSSLWSDDDARVMLQELMINLRGNELIEFAASYRQLGSDLVSTAEKLSEWCVDEMFGNPSPDFCMIRHTLGLPNEKEPQEVALSTYIRSFVQMICEARGEEPASLEAFQQPVHRNVLSLPSVSGKAV